MESNKEDKYRIGILDGISIILVVEKRRMSDDSIKDSLRQISDEELDEIVDKLNAEND